MREEEGHRRGPTTPRPAATSPQAGLSPKPIGTTPERLLLALDRLVRGRVAVVSGPAGHGKHELVAAWLQRHPEFASLTLDAPTTPDNKPSPDNPTSLDEVSRRLETAGIDAELLVAVVAERALLADPTFVARAIELAERQPRLRLVFVGRTRPDAPLGSLAARGLLVDLDADQLTWTRAEVARALAPMNPGLPEMALDTMMAGMRGWPAIVRMLAVEPLTWAHTSKVARLADSYIGEEVLAGLDEADLHLLQELSALPTLEPLAAAWMTGRGDAAAQLSRLQAHGVPITWDDANTIRLNPMLRGFLTRQLARDKPELSQELNQRAALWLRNRGRTMEAIALAMQVGLVDLAWMLAGEFITVSMHRPEIVASLPAMVELMPPGWELDTVRSVSRGLATPRTMIAQLGAIDARQMIERNDTGRFGYACFVLGMVRRVGYPADIDIHQALEIAAAGGSQKVHELDLALLSSVRTEYGLWLLHQGRLPQAQETLLGALGMARVVNVPWLIATTLSALAFIHAMQGTVEPAQRLAAEALATTTETTFTTDSLDEFALLALAMTATETGDLAAARRWLEQLDGHQELAVENDAIRTHVRASLLIAQEDPAGARRLVAAYRDEPRPAIPPLHELLLASAAFNAAIAMADLPAAEQEYRRIGEVGLPEQSTGRVVTQARLALAQGNPAQAHGLLAPLAELREPFFENAKHTLYMLMIFGVAADELHHGDEALQAFQRAGVLADRLGVDTASARHTRVAVASRKEVPLTEAERHVLDHLDSARTLGETAEELFISLNTLKTHLRRIYRKLGVANREQALERARVLGLRSDG